MIYDLAALFIFKSISNVYSEFMAKSSTTNKGSFNSQLSTKEDFQLSTKEGLSAKEDFQSYSLLYRYFGHRIEPPFHNKGRRMGSKDNLHVRIQFTNHGNKLLLPFNME